MALNVTFKLRDKRKNPTSIYLSFYSNYKKFVYGTGKTIDPNLWNFLTERPTTDKKTLKLAEKSVPGISADLENLNTYLNNLSSEVKKYFAYCEQQGITLTKDLLKGHLDSEIKKVEKISPDKIELNEFINQFLEGIESGEILTDKGKRYAHGTIKNYKGFKAQFEAYQKSRRKKMRFEEITIDFYDDFLTFFNSKKYSPNTIGRHIKNLKVIMRAAFEMGLHNTHEFERRKFKAIQIEVTEIYLNKHELRRLAELDLSKEPHMETVRDVFLVGCHIAQRYSDYHRLRPEHIRTTSEGTKVIELIQKKTGTKVVIPVAPELDAILSKYDYTLPKTHAQKVNDRMKKLGKRAKIDEPILIEKTQGGLKVKKQIPKYELIKTHTARRSGATNMYLADIPTLDIMKITGHKTEREFLKYIKVTKEQTADRLAKHAYFNQSPLRVAK